MASCIVGCVLVLINIPFFILGLVFLAAGGFVKFGGNFISSFVEPILAGMMKSLQGHSQTTFDVADLVTKILDIISGIAIGLIILGLFLFILSICGMCGVCCKSKVLLIVYLCITGVITVAMLGIAIWIITGSPLELIKKPVTQFLKGYKGTGSFDVNTLLIDVMNGFLECCGINNGTDFDSVPWTKSYNQTSGTTVELPYPATCCKLQKDMTPKYENCTTTPTKQNSNIHVGCWSKIEFYLKMTNYVSYGMFGLCGFLLILVVLAVLYLMSINKNKIDKI